MVGVPIMGIRVSIRPSFLPSGQKSQVGEVSFNVHWLEDILTIKLQVVKENGRIILGCNQPSSTRCAHHEKFRDILLTQTINNLFSEYNTGKCCLKNMQPV